jgi:hypothetical protein
MSPSFNRCSAFLLLVTLAVPAGCAQRFAARDLNLLTQEEMLEANFTNLHDAVSALRSNWLVVRGTDSFLSPSQVLVYFDQTRLGGVGELRAVLVNSVKWARHYSAVDATQRWGVGHGAGVIYLSSHQ